MQGRFAVNRAAVREAALPVLRHRIIPSFRAEADGLTADDIVSRLLVEVPAFAEPRDYDPAVRGMLRL